MFREFWLLARLEWKRFKSRGWYWLRLIGFDADQSRLYQGYIAVFWLFWVFAMWAFLVDQTYQISWQTSAETLGGFLQVVPVGVFGLQLLYLIVLLRDPPLKLDAIDLLYVATAPISRGVITLLHFGRHLLLPGLFLSMTGSLLAMLFAWKLDAENAGIIGLEALLISWGMVYITGAICWIPALLKQNRRSISSRRLFWLIVPPLALAAAAFPGISLWMGRIWISVIEESPVRAQLILLLPGVLLIPALVWTGSRMQMTLVMADSQMYARIQKLGVFGRVMAADVITRIQHQSQLARKRKLRAKFPASLIGDRALIGQSYVILMRLAPGSVLRLISSGGLVVTVVILMMTAGGGIPLQWGLILFLVLLQVRPYELTRVFRENLQQPFLRQFMPSNNLVLFLMTTAIPFSITSLGMILLLAVQPQIDLPVGIVLAISGLLTLGLCLALDLVRLTRYTHFRIAYGYSLFISGVIMVGAGYLFQSLYMTAAASVMVNGILMFLLHQSQPG